MYIPEIPDFGSPEYEDLISRLLEGMCIFMGAGISKLAGYKLWNELADEILRKFSNHKSKIQKPEYLTYSIIKDLEKAAKTTPRKVMDYFYSLDRNFFQYILKEIFIEDERKEKNEVFEVLSPIVQVKNNIFVQTNIDKAFQKYFDIPDTEIGMNPYLPNKPKKLNYLHGRIDEKETWVFTTQQYDYNYLGEKSKTFAFLVNLFLNNSVLFIGYSLRDFEIKQAISKARLKGQRRTHYFLVPYSLQTATELAIEETIFRENYGIHFIRYNIENKGHVGLINVLKALGSVVSYKRLRV